VASELTMPKLSDSMADAVIVRWLKSPGEAFERGEGLIEVETDKATVVYEAESAGTLDSILAPEGATVAVGEAIAMLGNGDHPPGGARRSAPAKAQPESPPSVTPADVFPREAGSISERLNASPVARRTAVELGVSLYGLAGTGPGGRITQADVQGASESGAVGQRPAQGGKGDVRTIEFTATQATIARRMVESATTIPAFTVSSDVDMSLIRELRRGNANDDGGAPSLNDFVVKAAGEALREFPRFNASYADGKVDCYARINVGIAVATDDALVVPVVFDADKKTLSEIAADTRRLADAARRRALQPDDLRDGTFTVSNLGMLGVRSFTAIIDPPQAAILAVGGIRRTATEDESEGVAFRDLMTVTLTCDHRIVYGADGARFLARLRELLERPLKLLS
jgi:pyruvate dehydrogenase E2 component (dihydrolipoamide acetyltransferase)